MKLDLLPILTDENIDSQIVTFLRESGFNVKDVKEERLTGSDDVMLMRLAVLENRAVLTHDSGFGTLAMNSGEPYVGLIYLRPGHIQPQFTVATIQAILNQNLDLVPPFIIVAARSGADIRIRIRQQQI